MQNKTSLLALALALGLAAPIAPVFAEDAPNYIEEMKRWQPKAEAGDAEAQFQLGQMYALGHGFKQNFNSALEWYEKAAAQGNAKARTALGMLYYYGVGVEENTEKAGEWFEKAAAQDEPNAQRYLGTIAYKEKDYTQAKQWWEQAAAQGHAPAIASLGDLYINGEGVTQDFAKARSLYEEGAKQEKYAAKSMIGLFEIYYEGKGVKESEKQAIEWAEKSCALETLGSAQGCALMGHAYFGGEIGLPKDNQKAFEYSMKAALNGYNGGAFTLVRLREQGFVFPDTDKEQVIEFTDNFQNRPYWTTRGVIKKLESLQD